MLGKGYLSVPLYNSEHAEETEHDTATSSELSIPFQALTLRHLAIDLLGLELTLNPKEPNEKYSGVFMLKADSISVPFHKDEKLSYLKAELKLKDVYAQPKKSIAYYMVDSINLMTENHTMAVHGLKLRQRIDELKYAKYFGFDKVYARADVNHIQIKGLPKRLRSLADGVHLSHISIVDPQAYLYKNSRLPHNMSEKKFIIEALQSVKLPIRIDTVSVDGGLLTFNQNWRKDYVPGTLRMTISEAQMLNYTNLGPDTAYGKWTTITSDLLLYDELPVKVKWKFDLAKKGTSYTLDVAFGKAAFAHLNPYSENTVGVRFKDGFLDGGRLLVEGNKQSVAGSLELYYHDLKVEFLDREDHHKNVVHWAEGSLANMVVRNNNIPDKKPRLGIVYAEPVADKAIFAFATKMLFSGFKDIALTSNNEDLVAKRGMYYLPMPEQAKESETKAAAKEERQNKRAQRKAKKAQ